MVQRRYFMATNFIPSWDRARQRKRTNLIFLKHVGILLAITCYLVPAAWLWAIAQEHGPHEAGLSVTVVCSLLLVFALFSSLADGASRLSLLRGGRGPNPQYVVEALLSAVYSMGWRNLLGSDISGLEASDAVVVDRRRQMLLAIYDGEDRLRKAEGKEAKARVLLTIAEELWDMGLYCALPVTRVSVPQATAYTNPSAESANRPRANKQPNLSILRGDAEDAV